MSYRRPTTMRYGPWMQDCISLLESGSARTIGDRRLGAWARLQRIAEEGLLKAGLEDCSSSESRDICVLESSLSQVRLWRHGLPGDIMSSETNPVQVLDSG